MSKREDAATVAALRRGHRPRQSFLTGEELQRLRSSVLRITQTTLAKALTSPDTGAPVSVSTLCRWESGEFVIPLWAARRIRQFAVAAKEQDAKEAR